MFLRQALFETKLATFYLLCFKQELHAFAFFFCMCILRLFSFLTKILASSASVRILRSLHILSSNYRKL